MVEVVKLNDKNGVIHRANRLETRVVTEFHQLHQLHQFYHLYHFRGEYSFLVNN